MKYAIPPIHCLTAFEAVARLRSLSRAADELNVSTSAVSHRLRQLQEGLGFRLFSGAQGEYKLSTKGTEYLGVVKVCLASLNHFPLETARTATRSTLRIASPPSFARYLLVERLPEFLRQHPRLTASLQISVPLVGLKSDDADVEIRFGDGHYEGQDTVPLLHEPVFPVCSPNYLSQHGPFPDPTRLANATLLRSTLEPWRPWFDIAGLDRPEPAAAVDYFDMGLLLQACVNGQGIALARQTIVADYLKSGALVRLSELSAMPPYGYYATMLPENASRPEVASFIAWLKETFGNVSQ
ncbi:MULTISPECIES: LysR substrate-binding domain-containing protein [Pandoraea]|uniref:LysR substrate-binding domain-containing protein n=1 Tax=Pandoraea TaxID=93217 RepID=UPI001F5D0B8F|nr:MULTISPECIES: LysR substrate-binding domain-containing protein [Pandoraea]MCI3206361.1 LysR family transcriptional regulator [Pandoraea sp. LA3]MDN4584389.1 LysR family transcriptional regulator [Pandoraea capi]